MSKKLLVFSFVLTILFIIPLSFCIGRKSTHTVPTAHVSHPMPDSHKMYPALFICHGGGPMPILGDPGSKAIVEALHRNAKAIVDKYGSPTAIAVVSAHYNTAKPSIGGSPFPEMLYDYGGFPKEAYSMKYPAPGQPELAHQMVSALKSAGLDGQFDLRRPYDHGVFVPLMLMFPSADIPVVPVSVLFSEDPAEHIKMGQALRSFRESGVLFVGSGSSMHHSGRLSVRGAGTEFGKSLTAALADDPAVTSEERLATFRKIETFAGFDDAQPRNAQEHLMPLLTLLGTANGGPAVDVGTVFLGSAVCKHYLFEEAGPALV